jgi:hypothetical protein
VKTGFGDRVGHSRAANRVRARRSEPSWLLAALHVPSSSIRRPSYLLISGELVSRSCRRFVVEGRREAHAAAVCRGDIRPRSECAEPRCERDGARRFDARPARAGRVLKESRCRRRLNEQNVVVHVRQKRRDVDASSGGRLDVEAPFVVEHLHRIERWIGTEREGE